MWYESAIISCFFEFTVRIKCKLKGKTYQQYFTSNFVPAEDVKEANWDQLISQDGLIAADFWATWCPFCMQLKPVFEEVSNDFADVKFVKVNVQEEPNIASKYGVQGIPVIKYFCKGMEVGSVLGFRTTEQLTQDVKKIMSEQEQCLANASKMK